MFFHCFFNRILNLLSSLGTLEKTKAAQGTNLRKRGVFLNLYYYEKLFVYVHTTILQFERIRFTHLKAGQCLAVLPFQEC